MNRTRSGNSSGKNTRRNVNRGGRRYVKRFSRSQKMQIRKFRTIGVLAFAAIMAVGAFIGLLFFVRPKKSITEKRELAKFPSFTITSFLDGSYFESVSLWYSDTYPMRDKLVSADQGLKSLYGIEAGTQVVGGNTKGDDIPEVDKDSIKQTSTEAATDTSTDTSTEDPEIGLPASKTDSKTNKGNSSGKTTVQTVEPPDSKAMDEAFQKQLQDNLYVKDGAAYSLYYFVQDSATEYIDALNNAAAKLSGVANVYDILIPNNSGVLLSDDDLAKLGGSDQKQAIEYYYSLMQGVKTVDIFDTLKSHNDEYIYFRTDHHWTADGAFYAYEEFCKAKGITEIPREKRKKDTFEGFLGSFYSNLQNQDMKKKPDTIYAYEPIGTNDMTYWNDDGSEQKWNVIMDVNGWDKGTLYSTFVGGDTPMAVIENPNVTDGSTCVVMKESYGNAFIPFLVDHYSTIYILDYRYSNVNVIDFVKEKQADDLICINNISLIGDEDVAATIKGVLQ